MRGFMAILAHWIQRVPLPTPAGKTQQYTYHMRHDLIGFHYLPGSHSGAHICAAFVKVANDFGIMSKVRNLFVQMHNN
jgi:hypothetical protein